MSYLELAKRAKVFAPNDLADSTPSAPSCDAAVVWSAAVDRLAAETDWTADLIAALRSATPCWTEEREVEVQAQTFPYFPGPRAHPECTEIDWPDPCKSCGSLELWEAIGGAWRCQHCDPPEASRRFRVAAERIRRRTPQLRQDSRGSVRTAGSIPAAPRQLGRNLGPSSQTAATTFH